MAITQAYTGNTLPEWYKALLEEMGNRSQFLAGAHYAPYRGQRIAPIPHDMLRAMHLARREGMFDPYAAASHNVLNRTNRTFPQAAHEYMNPYQQHVVDRIREEGMRNFNEGTMPALEAYFIQRGHHGSSRHATMAQRAARDAQNEILRHQREALATGYQQAGQLFNADQAKAIQNSEQLMKLGAAKQAANASDITALEAAGRYNQQQQQAQNEQERKDYLERTEFPMQQLSNQAAILNGMTVPSSQAYINQQPNMPQANMAANYGALGSSLFSMLNRKRGGSVRWGRI